MGILRKLSYTEALDYVEKNKRVIRPLYFDKDLTAKKIAENQNVSYDANFQKALFKVMGPKGKGHGGSRPGAGNKPGIEFCGTCRQTSENCKCEK